jgi:hypothetical protein
VPPDPPVPPDPTPEPRSRLWLILLALLALAAAGAAAYWYLNPEPMVPPEIVEPPAPPTPPEPPPEPPVPPEPPEPPVESACAAGARLGAENATAAQWLEAIEACSGEGGGEALVGLLDACMASHPSCLVEMGRCYDPRYEASASCGIALYPDVAADYYSRAAEAGAEGAAAELESLCTHLNETDPEQAMLAGC